MHRPLTHRRSLARALLLTASLGSLTAAPARAQGAGSLGQVGQIWQFIQQIQQWEGSLTNLDQLKNDIFGSVNYNDVAQQLLGRAGDYGLKLAGIDVKGLIGTLTGWQAKVNEIRQGIVDRAGSVVSLAFLDPQERGTRQEGTLAVNQNLAQDRYTSAQIIADAGKKASQNVQDVADGAAYVEQSKKTVDETKGRADQSAQNASALTQAAMDAQSTREATQIMVRAQAELITSSAYNATALTTGLSQQVRETQVTNKQLSELVNGMLRDRTAKAQEALQQVRARQQEAQDAGDQVQSIIGTAADGISSAMGGDPSDLDSNDMF